MLITLYRPPNIHIQLFRDQLTELLHYLGKENKYICIIGDSNVDTISAIIKPNVNVNNFQNMFLSYFYPPLIDNYTREDKKRGTATLLDNIYTNTTHINL